MKNNIFASSRRLIRPIVMASCLLAVALAGCGGGGSGESESPCVPSGDSACTQTVFVTDAIMLGNFAAGSAIGALAEADAICQGEANNAGLSGNYLAWLSDNIASPATRFTQSSDPYVLPTGDVIADNWADLTDGGLQTAISLNASGQAPAGTCGTRHVWTGTTINGTPTGSNCSAWSALSSTTFGRTNNAGPGWTDSLLSTCTFRLGCRSGSDTGGRLYCVEQ